MTRNASPYTCPGRPEEVLGQEEERAEEADEAQGRQDYAPGELSAVMGLAMARFVFQMEPVASADAETLAAWYGPVVQRLLFDPLPGAEAQGP